MRLSVKAVAVSILFSAAFAAVSVTTASATTFCVPDFHAACPNSGGNVAQANLETAMGTLSSDGNADRILIGSHTYSDPATLQPVGSDDLAVIGSGTDKTFITSSLVGGNNFVVNLNFGNRKVDMKDLTIVVPASFTDVLGSGIQAKDGTFDNVNIEVRNIGSGGAPSLVGNVIWKNSRIYAAAGGQLNIGIAANHSIPGTLQVINTSIESPSWGVRLDGSNSSTRLSRVRITDAFAYGIQVSDGGQLTVENSIIETGGQGGISIATDSTPTDPNIAVAVRNSTFVNAAPLPADPAISVQIGAGLGSRSAAVTVSESIFRGFDKTWEMITPAGPGIGQGSLVLTDSNFVPTGLPVDSPVVDFSDPGNINQDPLFIGPTDYRLGAGSPSIDAGDPAAGLIEDFAGNPRPLDGNGDGTRVRDMGAFEAAEIPTCATTPSFCPDTIAPTITKLKFKHGKTPRKGGTLKFNLSEAATVKATFKPTPAKAKGKKRKTLKLSKKGKAGVNTLIIGKRKLKPGKYRLTISATDAAGNKSKAVVRRVKVK